MRIGAREVVRLVRVLCGDGMPVLISLVAEQVLPCISIQLVTSSLWQLCAHNL